MKNSHSRSPSTSDVSAPRQAEDSERTLGRWDPVFALPNVAIHTNVLPNGKVLFWGRRDHPNGSMHEHECTPHVWDPETGETTPTPQPTRADGTKVNLFCAGHTFLPDGQLLVAGGHFIDSDGLDQACGYDYRTNTWTPLPVMNERRWYPTVTALADGTALVSSGSYIENDRVIINDIPQIWDGHEWRATRDFIGLPLYPRMHVAPNGQLFMSGSNAQTYLLNTDGKGTWTPLPEPGGIRRNGERQYGPSVMYDIGKVIYIGGGNDRTTDLPTAATEVIDLNDDPPVWRQIAPMRLRRRQHNATILADGSVLVTGGTSGPGFNDLSPGSPVHVAELWDPVTGEWTELAAEDVDRCYHGTAVLLPDATVLSAGSGEFVVGDEPNDPRDTHRDAQVFHPPYLFQGPRPVITDAPGEIEYGETFSLEISGSDVGKITWIRLPSATHSFDENQRINFLRFSLDGTRVTVTAPERPEICPPGHYLLFVISKAGVPSHARIVRIGALAPIRPRTAASPTVGESESVASRAQETPTQERDEAVRTHSTGTRVTIGLTAKCPYGLGACWGGAYEALKKLDGVAAVRPIANAEDSTAEVFLRDQGLPDLDSWPEQIARWANGSYDFRGVEVTVTGTVQTQDGGLQLTGPSLDAPVRLVPLQQDMKLQWDHRRRGVKDATSEEQDAYQGLARTYQDRAGGSELMHITGPLTRTAAGWTLHVRTSRPSRP